MRKTIFLLLLILLSLSITGFTPDPGYDYAQYQRLPMTKRIDKLQKAGEDLFTRRRYEDSLKVFETILKLRNNDLKAKFWFAKAEYEIKREQEEKNKEELYKKYKGHLLPEDSIYGNWKWAPEVGHFEVRYSKPKPKPVYIKKIRPRATDEVINAALAKAKKGNATDTFEVAMLYWTRRDRTNAIKYLYEAFNKSPEVLMLDDEGMISTVLDEVAFKVNNKTSTADDYYEAGRLHLVQGNRFTGIQYLLRASIKDKAYKKRVEKVFSDFLDTPALSDVFVAIPEVFAFRQAYVYNKNKDYLYVYMYIMPRKNMQIFSVDINIPFEAIKNSYADGQDTSYCFARKGIDDSARLWFILPEKLEDEMKYYEVKGIIEVDRTKAESIDLSNYAVDVFDNWSFIIANSVNFSSLGNGVNEFNENGLRISGYHLYIYQGRGPYIELNDFTENIPTSADVKDIWSLMKPREYELDVDPEIYADEQRQIASQQSSEENEHVPPVVKIVGIDSEDTDKPTVINGNAVDNKTPALPAGDINDMDIGL